MDTLWPADVPTPQEWTVEDLARAGFHLTVYCQGTCRAGRQIDLLALSAAGQARRRVAALKFRCGGCGAAGQPLASWWSGGYSSWDYGRDVLRGAPPAKWTAGNAKSPPAAGAGGLDGRSGR